MLWFMLTNSQICLQGQGEKEIFMWSFAPKQARKLHWPGKSTIVIHLRRKLLDDYFPRERREGCFYMDFAPK